MQYSQLQALAPANVNYSRQIDTAAHSVSLILVFPLVLILTIIGYQKYRTSVLRQQIKMLERQWQLTYQKKPKC